MDLSKRKEADNDLFSAYEQLLNQGWMVLKTEWVFVTNA